MIAQAPSVAIITPSYNHRSYIGACLESALRQTRLDWEMVVVDDGSTDGTADIAESFGDPRIQVVRREHRGLARLGEAYQVALASTRAPLVAVLEGDDSWPPDKLARQLPAFEDESVVLSYGAAAQIDEHGCSYAVYRRRPPGEAALNRPPGSILPYLVHHNFIVAPTVVVRRRALEEIGGFWQPVGIPYVDHPTWLRLSLIGAFAYEPTVVGHWRRHSAQFTTSRAVGAQPDNRHFLLEVVSEGASRGVLVSSSLLQGTVLSGPVRHARRSDISAFRLALLDRSLRDAFGEARPLLASRHPKSLALAAVGLASRLVGSDVEWLFRATNRFSWPGRRHRRLHGH